MRLYLVQHGDSVPEQADPQRPLSAAGRRQVEAIGSPARQRRRTARRGLSTAASCAPSRRPSCWPWPAHPSSVVEAAAGLSPNDPVKPVARMVASLSADTMLVGHLPFMARLAGRLVTGDEHVEVVAFVPGTVLCLEPAAGDRWTVAWMVRPELATREA